MTTSAAAAAADLISELNDDVLLHILSLLPSARDVARTSVLSKRWRHLWSTAPCLRFAQDNNDGHGVWAAQQLIAVVDATLERRADEGTDVDVLEITFAYRSSRPPYVYHRHHVADDVTSSHSHAAAWLRFAGRHVSRSFAVDLLPVEEPWRQDIAALFAGDHAQLPRSARVETMRLQLGFAALTVPAAVTAGTYHALTNFQLHYARLAASAGADNLGHLLSPSSSPRLRRLSLLYVTGLAELRLDMAGTLEELELVYLPNLLRLDVGAPGLRMLHVDFDLDYSKTETPTARISAPRLEVLKCGEELVHPEELQFDGAAAVRHIKRLVLFSATGDDESNATAIWLLKNCTAMNHLELELVPNYPSGCPLDEDIIEDVPQLPNVTNLIITTRVEFEEGHTVGASVTRLITKCNNIKHLSIGIKGPQNVNCFNPSCFCYQPEGWQNWTISLEQLRTVNIHDFIPVDDRISLVQLLLASSPALETMTVELDCFYLKNRRKEGKNKVEFDIPCSQGFWIPCCWEVDELFSGVTKYKWTRTGEEN